MAGKFKLHAVSTCSDSRMHMTASACVFVILYACSGEWRSASASSLPDTPAEVYRLLPED